MAAFEYHALTSEGRLMKGTLEAGSPEEARALLAEMRLTINYLGEAPKEPPKTALGRSEFLLFNQQLAAITKAGIPLEQGLRELAGDVQSGSMRQVILEIADDLEKGTGIEEAFARHGKRFGPLYGTIVRAGVQTGRLSEMLTSLNTHLQFAAQTRRILFEALCYPAIVLALAAAVLTFLFVYVVPQFGLIYEGMGVDLPALTVAVLFLADHVAHCWLIVGALIVSLAAMRWFLSLSPEGRRAWERFFVHLPVVGRLHRASLLSRLADGMAILVGAGCDLPTSLRLGASATGSEVIRGECETLARTVEKGDDILAARDSCSAIPGLMLYSIRTGSQRNDLEDHLYSLSEMYAVQARQMQGTFQAMLSPFLLILVGLVVAGVLAAMFLPMSSLVENLSG